jgi:hypothetical protein
LRIETTLETKRKLDSRYTLRWSARGTCDTYRRGDQDQEARRWGPLRLVAPRPACKHSDSLGSHRHKRNTKNPKFYPLEVLSFSSVFYPFSPTGRTGRKGTPGSLPTHGIGVVPHHLLVMPLKAVRPTVPRGPSDAAALERRRTFGASTRYPCGCDEAG